MWLLSLVMEEEKREEWRRALPPTNPQDQYIEEIELTTISIPTSYTDLSQMLGFREVPYTPSNQLTNISPKAIYILGATFIGILSLSILFTLIKLFLKNLTTK